MDSFEKLLREGHEQAAMTFEGEEYSKRSWLLGKYLEFRKARDEEHDIEFLLLGGQPFKDVLEICENAKRGFAPSKAGKEGMIAAADYIERQIKERMRISKKARKEE